MRWTIGLLILLGVGAALCAAILVGTLKTRTIEVVPATPVSESSVEILVATRPIEAMTVLEASAVERREVPAAEVPPGAEGSLTQVIGQILVLPMVEGEVFTKTHFAKDGAGLSLAVALPAGHRAMSTFLSTESGIEDILYPGCVVDVVASFRMPSRAGSPSGEVLSSTLIQGVQVLKVGPRTIGDNGSGDATVGPAGDRKRRRMVTLMVNPEQAEILQLATAHGEITLAMRNPMDDVVSETSGTFLSDLSGNGAIASLFEDPEVTEESPREDDVWTTTILRGGKEETVTFPR